MKEEDEKTAHAVLSASGSERWLGCPASISLSKGLPNIQHESGQAGTNAHTLFQFILENANWENLLSHKSSIEFRRRIDFVSHQLRAVMVGVKYVHAERRKMYKANGQWPQMFTEKKVILKGVGFGRSDVILYQPFGLLHVMDFKNGVYPVSPVDNTQGLYYGCAIADEMGWDFSRAAITIIQPNVSSGEKIKTWYTTPKRLEQAKLMFERGAKLTRLKKPAVVLNHKYCWFCPARMNGCPAHAKQRVSKIAARFERNEK